VLVQDVLTVQGDIAHIVALEYAKHSPAFVFRNQIRTNCNRRAKIYGSYLQRTVGLKHADNWELPVAVARGPLLSQLRLLNHGRLNLMRNALIRRPFYY
jgi:hypothetical protein